MKVEFTMEEAQAALTTYLREHVLRGSKFETQALEVTRDAIGPKLILTFEWAEDAEEVRS